jgi:FKBP-type peptidyl-prolyl cis-trans isomerase
MRIKSLWVPLLLGALLLGLALAVRSGRFARDNPGAPIGGAARLAAEQPRYTSDEERVLAERFPDAERRPSGLIVQVRVPGEGPTPQTGDRVTVHYDGRLLTGGKFDSSYDRGQPIDFRLGVREVIAGWEEGIADMRRGERRTLIVPWWLGYGERGRAPLIPARATLVFEVELIDF